MPSKVKFKKFLDSMVDPFVRSGISWPFFSLFARLGEYFRYRRSLHENRLANQELAHFYKDAQVRNGFFKGMKYPSLASAGSSLFPKLLGCYESELFPFFESVHNVEYDKILDIGCAEGYYAVGMAMRFPQAAILAYDIDETALQLCGRMAELNGVGKNITLNNSCNAEVLRSTDLSKKNLIICDCEGYERWLFLKEDVTVYKNSDLVIELHPFEDKGIKEYLVDIFKDTHSVNLVASFDDKRKLFDNEDQLKGLSELAKLKSVQEGRSFTMEWLILRAG